MEVAVGADHAGYPLKQLLSAHLAVLGHGVTDLGTGSEDPVDYPEFGAAVGRAVVGGVAELGLCVCGTGIGISIAANKVPGVRAAVVHDVTTARLARAHNHANVLCMGGRIVGEQVAKDALEVFLATSPAGGRHLRRVAELAGLEEGAPLPGSFDAERRLARGQAGALSAGALGQAEGTTT
jgi:ribose 5-phosphate isomerase B